MLRFGSFSSFEIQTISRECAVYNTNRMGTEPSCPSHAPRVQQLSHPGHGPSSSPCPSLPAAAEPAGVPGIQCPCCQGGLQIILALAGTTDLVVKALLRLAAVSRASLCCRIQHGWHPELPTVTLHKHWGKAAVSRGCSS